MSRSRRGAPLTHDASLREGLVVGAHGRHCVVETPAGERVICHPRGKKLAVVVGDRVRWLPSQDEGTIERIDERRNLLYRQDEVRTKSFAANLDQVLILVAAEPEFSEHQLARALIACEAEHIEPLIVLNKADLTEPFARAWARLAPYRAMGYTVLPLAAKPAHPHPNPLPPAGEGAESAPPAASSELLPRPSGERACPGLDPGAGVRGAAVAAGAVCPHPNPAPAGEGGLPSYRLAMRTSSASWPSTRAMSPRMVSMAITPCGPPKPRKAVWLCRLVLQRKLRITTSPR